MIINGNLKLNESNITSLGKLKEVNGYLDITNCLSLKDLGNIKKVKQISLKNTPNIKSIPRNLQIEQIFKFDKDWSFFRNWNGFKYLKEITLSESFIQEKLDFFNIPSFIEDHLNKIYFFSPSSLIAKLKEIDFKDIPKNYKHYDFLIDSIISSFKYIPPFKKHGKRTQNGFEITWEEKWGERNSIYSENSEPISVFCDYDLINLKAYYFFDASGLIENEYHLDENEEPENFGHTYEVKNIKFNSLQDILKVESASDIIEIGVKNGVRYDY